jgi:hypothetical protein
MLDRIVEVVNGIAGIFAYDLVKNCADPSGRRFMPG